MDNQLELASPLDEHVEGGVQTYWLSGRPVADGDQIEVWTPLGWLGGMFEWSSVAAHLPRLVVTFDEPTDSLLVVVLLPGSTCRWPVVNQHVS